LFFFFDVLDENTITNGFNFDVGHMWLGYFWTRGGCFWVFDQASPLRKNRGGLTLG
jgi:hypothetical protein